MATKSEPKRTSGKSAEAAAGGPAKADSCPIGTGSKDRGVYVNERGQVCYGSECFTLAVDAERHEIVVNVKPGATCNNQPLIDAMRDVLGKGARTVYEVESVIKEDSK